MGLGLGVEACVDGAGARVDARVDGAGAWVDARVDGAGACVDARVDGAGACVDARVVDGAGAAVATDRCTELGARVVGDCVVGRSGDGAGGAEIAAGRTPGMEADLRMARCVWAVQVLGRSTTGDRGSAGANLETEAVGWAGALGVAMVLCSCWCECSCLCWCLCDTELAGPRPWVLLCSRLLDDFLTVGALAISSILVLVEDVLFDVVVSAMVVGARVEADFRVVSRAAADMASISTVFTVGARVDGLVVTL